MNLPLKTGYKKARSISKTIKTIQKEADQIVSIAILAEPKVEAELSTLLHINEAKGKDTLKGIFSVNKINQENEKEDALSKSDLALVVVSQDTQKEYLARLIMKARISKKRLMVVVGSNEGNLKAAKLAEVFSADEEDIIFIPRIDENSLRHLIVPRILGLLKNKDIALAKQIELFRDEVIEQTIRRTAYQNALIGVVIFIPGADMPLLTMNQIRMVLKICAIYDYEISVKRLYEILGVVMGGFLFREIARQLVAFIPVLGWLIKGVVAYAGTLAIGKISINYLESKISKNNEISSQ